MNVSLVLYGPPAAGKDTVTGQLLSIHDEYRLFEKLKSGAGRSVGYRIVTDSVIDEFHARGDVLWETRRYGARYVIDRGRFTALARTTTLIVHVGELQAIEEIAAALDGIAELVVVSLWCPRPVAAERISRRRTGDDIKRLDLWDSTPPLHHADLSIDTGTVGPVEAAQAIHETIRRQARSGC